MRHRETGGGTKLKGKVFCGNCAKELGKGHVKDLNGATFVVYISMEAVFNGSMTIKETLDFLNLFKVYGDTETCRSHSGVLSLQQNTWRLHVLQQASCFRR